MTANYLSRILGTSLGLGVCGVLWSCSEEEAPDVRYQTFLEAPPDQVVTAETPRELGGNAKLAGQVPEAAVADVAQLASRLSSTSAEDVNVTVILDRFLLESDNFEGYVTKNRHSFVFGKRAPLNSEELVNSSAVGSFLDALSGQGIVHPDADSMIQTARELTKSLGADDSEMDDAVHRTISLRSPELSEKLQIHQKVFIFRRVAGIAVPEDRSVITFDNQGRFVSIKGQWTPYGNGGEPIEFTTVTGIDELVDRAHSVALSRHASADVFSKALKVRTIFEIEQLGDTVSIQLRGEVAVPLRNHLGEQNFNMITFDL